MTLQAAGHVNCLEACVGQSWHSEGHHSETPQQNSTSITTTCLSGNLSRLQFNALLHLCIPLFAVQIARCCFGMVPGPHSAICTGPTTPGHTASTTLCQQQPTAAAAVAAAMLDSLFGYLTPRGHPTHPSYLVRVVMHPQNTTRSCSATGSTKQLCGIQGTTWAT